MHYGHVLYIKYSNINSKVIYKIVTNKVRRQGSCNKKYKKMCT